MFTLRPRLETSRKESSSIDDERQKCIEDAFLVAAFSSKYNTASAIPEFHRHPFGPHKSTSFAHELVFCL